MFDSHKRIFAGKQNVHYEPFCPCLSNDRGFRSMFSAKRLARRKNETHPVARRERRIV